MHRRKEPSPDIHELARQQGGVVSHAQLVLLGLPPKAGRRWKRGWFSVAPGIYCLREPTWESWCWAGVLYAGPSAVTGSLAAAHWHGLTVVPPEDIVVWHERSSHLKRLGNTDTSVTFRRSQRSGRGDPPRTGVEVTLLDAAGDTNEDQIVAIATRALAQRLTTPGRLMASLSERPRLRHRSVMVQLCDSASTGVESVLEWRFLQIVVRAHALPDPERQVVLRAGTRSDCLWREFGIVVELDGRVGHGDAFRDMDRDNRLAMVGWVTLRYGWHDVTTRPCEVAWSLHQILQERGFQGSRTRCRRCQRVGVA